LQKAVKSPTSAPVCNHLLTNRYLFAAAPCYTEHTLSDKEDSSVLKRLSVLLAKLDGCTTDWPPACCRRRRRIPAGRASAAASAAAGTSSAAGAPRARGWQLRSHVTDGDWTVYTCGGVQIALPTKDVGPADHQGGPVETDFGTTLLSVNEKASWDQSIADCGGSEGAGFLFSISRLTRAQYETYLAGGRDGEQAFAVSGKADDDRFTTPVAETYYVYGTATDVQFYRTGGKIDTNSQDWKDWEALLELGTAVRTDMITRNGLTAYGDEEFLNQEFTWTGDHAYVRFYPYYAVDGTTAEYDTLVLSQPARQGEGGIWCVERWYDQYGNCCIWFPGILGAGNSGVTAKDYFAKLQKAADAGDTAYLTPLDAAKKTDAGHHRRRHRPHGGQLCRGRRAGQGLWHAQQCREPVCGLPAQRRDQQPGRHCGIRQALHSRHLGRAGPERVWLRLVAGP
jgi:hypothetical protein